MCERESERERERERERDFFFFLVLTEIRREGGSIINSLTSRRSEPENKKNKIDKVRQVRLYVCGSQCLIIILEMGNHFFHHQIMEGNGKS